MATFGEFLYGASSITYTSPISGDQAGVTHNIVMDNVGLMTAGTPTRSDITSAIPRISIGSEQRQHTDFSERDTFGQSTYHHGFGELNFSDRAKFMSSEGVWTLVPDQVTLAPQWTSFQWENADGTGDDYDFNGVIKAQSEWAANTWILVSGDASAQNALYYWYNAGNRWRKHAAAITAMNTSDGTPTDLQGFGTGANSNLYIAQGEATNMVRLNSNLSTAADNGVPAKFVESFAGKLWRADNLNEIYYSVDPHTDGSATWTAPTGENEGTIGDSTYLIRGMTVHDNALWIGKDDGIYKIYNSASASGTEVWQTQKVIDLSHLISEFNGQSMISFGGNLYFSVDRGLGKWDGATLQMMGPDKGSNATENFMQLQSIYDTALPQDINTEAASLNSGIVGTIRSMSHDGTNLYVAVDSGGNTTGGSFAESRVMAWNGSGWHQVYSTNEWNTSYHDPGDYRVQFVGFVPRKGTTGWDNYPRILIGNEAVVNEEEDGIQKEDGVLQAYLPRWGQNLLDDLQADGNHFLRFQTTGYLVTSWFDGGLPDVEKTFFDVVVEAQAVGLSTGDNSIKVEYQVDNIDVWNELHQQTDKALSDVDLVVSSPLQKLTFPDNGNLDKSIYAKKIRLRFTLTQATTGVNREYFTPVLKSWAYHFVVRPESRFGWNLTVKCYDNLIDLQRRQVSRPADELRQYLYSLRDQKIPIIFHDGTELHQIKNKVLNPSMEYLTGIEGTAPNGYTAVGSTISTTSQYRSHGFRSMKVDPSAATGDASVTIGTFDLLKYDNVFAAATIFVPEGTDNVYLQVIKTSDSSILAEIEYTPMTASGEFGDIYLANHTRWVRKTLFAEGIPAAANYTFRVIRKSADADTVAPFYVDTVEFSNNGPNNLKQTNYDYVDGDQLRCRWLGTPHNSESVRQSGYQVYITGMTESFRYPEVLATNTTFDSEITLSLREVS